ncbi:dentin sialophosphoprotein [Ceratitis capitata]|uniref:dentin sialophosphoprotein n=1 Tax=Ceratitis capitata TaxID=7213 RepID=UPI000329D2A7|nr:dentin sialophosphoprotein [Ceratitis capitata]
MLYKIALITLLSITTTISARSLEGYKCREQTILTEDPLTPLRTVRICGVMDYPTGRTNYYQTVADIGEKVHPSAPTSNYFNRRYSSSGAWPSQDQRFQRTFSPPFSHWPAQPVQTESNESEKLLLNFFKSMQPLNEPKFEVAATNYPSNTASTLNADKLLEVQRFNEQSVNTIAEEATEIKSSVTDVVAQMKNMLGTLLLAKAKQAEESTININVNLKLDSSFQSLLQDFLVLAKADMDSGKNVATDESAENVSVDNNNNDENDDNNVLGRQDNSEEHVTQEQIDSEESSNESDDKEDSEAKSSSEDFDTWFRIHFGPSVKLHHTEEDTDNDDGEADNSSEKSEESFESWFNAVYRKYATVEEKDYETPEESTTNAQASNEIIQSENIDSSNENNSHNEHDEWKIVEEEQKSAEVNSEDSNDDNDDNNDYATFFVPTTMDPTQRDVSAEFLLNDNKYLYSTENNFNYDEISEHVKLSCLLEALSLDSYITCLKRNFEEQDERVEIGDNSDSASDSQESAETEGDTTDSSESKESAETEGDTTDSSESKESGETVGDTTDSSESKESGETESATTDSSESKESGETEGATTDSSESKESGETEGDTTGSSESKESGETESATTDSSESKESAEAEGATTDSSESKESAEAEGATTDSSESKESAETEEENNWYDYSENRLIWINEK